MKRILSIVLVIVTLLTSTVTLGGCTTEGKNTLTIGQWLGMVNYAFGMESYAQEEPYISSVDSSNEYFNTIQIAAEWDVIDTNKTIDPEDKLRWKDAIITLVNVGNFTKHDASDNEKIQYAIDNFDKTIRKYWMNRCIDVATATNLLVEAQEQWANRTYEETIEEIAYTEGVIELTSNDASYCEFTANDTILMPKEAADKLKEGDIFVLPNEGDCSTPKAYKVEDIKIENGVVEVVTDDELELGDFVDELYIQDTFSPDLTKAEFYDGNGNLLQGGNNIVPQSNNKTEDYTVTNLTYNGSNAPKATKLVAKTSFEFEVDGCKVELTIKSDGLSAKIEMPLTEDKKTKGYYEVEVSNFEVTNKIDYSWFTLHSAELKVDYETKNTIGVKKTYKEEKAVYAPKWSNGNGKFLTNLKNSVWKNAASEKLGAKTIKIGSIKVASVGVASFSVDVYAKLKVDGSIEISCTEVGCKGIEYKKGTCRVINTSDKDTDVKFKCKAEGTVSVVPTVNAFGVAIIGLKAEAGLGAEASLTFHLVDAGSHLLQETEASDLPPEVVEAMDVTGLTADAEEIKKLAEEQGGTFEYETSTIDLHIDTCIDINVYFILRVGIEEETLAGKLLNGTKIKVTWEIFGSKNAKICNLHIENFDFITAFSNIAFFTDKNQCTLKYKPFDDVKEEETKDETITNDTNGIEVGEVLVISDLKLIIQAGSSKTIRVLQLPEGYELKDVVCESSNSKIASVDKNGVITAGEEGSTTIIVKTKDGKYSCACSVTVISEQDKEFTPLAYFVKVFKYEGANAV